MKERKAGARESCREVLKTEVCGELDRRQPAVSGSMTAFCDLFVSLRNRRKRRAPDVTCETLVGVEPGNSVTFKKKSWRRKKPGKLSEALTRLRDAYVNIMVNAAYKGDMSTLVYGNAYCGNEFRFDSSYSELETKAYIGGNAKRSSYR